MKELLELNNNYSFKFRGSAILRNFNHNLAIHKMRITVAHTLYSSRCTRHQNSKGFQSNKSSHNLFIDNARQFLNAIEQHISVTNHRLVRVVVHVRAHRLHNAAYCVDATVQTTRRHQTAGACKPRRTQLTCATASPCTTRTRRTRRPSTPTPPICRAPKTADTPSHAWRASRTTCEGQGNGPEP